MIQSGANPTVREPNAGKRWESMTHYEQEVVARRVLRWMCEHGRTTDARVGEALFEGDAAAARVILEALERRGRVVPVTTAGEGEWHWLATENPAP